MKIESMDPKTLAISVSCGRDEALGLARTLSSLVMVAADCQVPSIRFRAPAELPRCVRAAIEELAARNPILVLESLGGIAPQPDGSGEEYIGRDEHIACIRDRGRPDCYSLLIAGVESSVERASCCAYLIAAALGFASDFSFEVRFSVYELLANVVEHGLAPGAHEWIEIDLERVGDQLDVTIVDRGDAFDPTGEDAFDLDRYVAERKRRGLGLIMARRSAEQLIYERGSGCNKVILRKSLGPRGADARAGKEKHMPQFEIGAPERIAEGMHSIALSGDLDAKGALMMEEMLNGLLKKKIFRLALDFEKVQFISSAGVGILLGVVSTLRDAGGDAVFVKVSPKVISVLRLLNLEDYFTMRDSVESAV